MSELDILKSALGLCIVKENSSERSASVAYAASGNIYAGALVEGDTNLMTIPSEHVALARSTVSNDFPITKVVTLHAGEAPFSVSPIVVKILADYAARTGTPIAYSVVGAGGATLFGTEDARDLFPHYAPITIDISRTKQAYSPNKRKTPNIDIAAELKAAAIEGLTRNFPLYDTASGYGTAVLTKDGTLYFGGQYSAPDKRLGLHSEMTTLLSAFMDGATDIAAIGLVSTKYKDEPCNMCGICRQFVAEMSAKFGFAAELYCFAKDADESNVYTIEHYLPSSWTSKKWTR